jgi:hypothetical protein
VEAQAKKRYEQLHRELLKKGGEAGLGQKLEILRLFLESADFGKLRSESEKYLLDGKRVKFVLSLAKGKLKYEMKII